MRRMRQIVKWFACASALGFIMVCISWILVEETYKRHWNSQQAAYELQDEYVESNTLRIFRITLAKIGIDSQTWIGKPLEARHEAITQRALAKIPEKDGERAIWQIWYETDFWNDVISGNNLQQNWPEASKKLGLLIDMPTKSLWASIKKNFYAYKLANYYLYNYSDSGLNPDARYEATKNLIAKMDAHAPDLNPALFVAERRGNILPLLWENSILVGATYVIYDPQLKIVRCDSDVMALLNKNKKRASDLITLYLPHVNDENKNKIEQIAYKIDHDLKKFEDIIMTQCRST